MESAHAMRPLQHVVRERTGHDEPLASAQGLHRIVHGMGGLGRVGARTAVLRAENDCSPRARSAYNECGSIAHGRASHCALRIRSTFSSRKELHGR